MKIMKTQKNFFGAFFDHFSAKRKFYEKSNPLLSLFSVSKFLLMCRISEKSNEQIARKVGYRRTQGQTWVHGTPLQGSKEYIYLPRSWVEAVFFFFYAIYLLGMFTLHRCHLTLSSVLTADFEEVGSVV